MDRPITRPTFLSTDGRILWLNVCAAASRALRAESRICFSSGLSIASHLMLIRRLLGDFIVMTGTNIALVLALYFLLAFVFGVFSVLWQPPPGADSPTTIFGFAVFRAVGIFVVAGILPVIGWAFGRFRTRNAKYPLLAWPVIGVALAGLYYAGKTGFFERPTVQQQIDAMISGEALVEKQRDDIREVIREACIDVEQKRSINRQAGVTDKQIDTYCNCVARETTNQLTRDEIIYIAQKKQRPDSANEKVTSASLKCGRQLQNTR
jgi:hypothetical protein